MFSLLGELFRSLLDAIFDEGADALLDSWGERARDGRARYAMAGSGLGLLVGSLTASVGHEPAQITWSGFAIASISILGVAFGLGLLAIARIWPRLDEELAWERRLKTARRRLITKADNSPQFRDELKANPLQTFERELRRALTVDAEVVVLEETSDHRYFVLQPSVLSRGQPDSSSRAAKWCECAWTERAEDGRVRHATLGFGLGLLIGSLWAVAGENTASLNWGTDYGHASIAFLSFMAGVALFVIALMPESSTGKDWSWRRRSFVARLIAKANCDPKFREELKADVRSTVERCGGTIRDGVEITVLEESPEHQYIVL